MSTQKDVTALPERLAASVPTGKSRGLPPVHLWNPPLGGDSNMVIARDGTWFYQGTPIRRPAMVRLFSTILKREGDEVFLVTPVEKLRITVEDAPFLAVDVEATGAGRDQVLTFQTGVGDLVVADLAHPIAMRRRPGGGEPAPYVHVRGGLDARVDRKSFYRLVDLGCEEDDRFGVWSSGAFFALDEAQA